MAIADRIIALAVSARHDQLTRQLTGSEFKTTFNALESRLLNDFAGYYKNNNPSEMGEIIFKIYKSNIETKAKADVAALIVGGQLDLTALGALID